MTGMTTPEAVAQANGMHPGWKKYFNFDTLKGRYGVCLVCIGIYVGVYKACTWKYSRPNVLAERKAVQDEKDLFDRQIEAWIKNGRKFD